ncbi:hypothetical protein [Hoyosella subflava]|uniref:hypothetical protein n=1 Tax=Hoyosella subflava TaxID=639313 RepID=UPI0002F82E9C|nr:hypothetical protein [Hoyosella subflava]
MSDWTRSVFPQLPEIGKIDWGSIWRPGLDPALAASMTTTWEHLTSESVLRSFRLALDANVGALAEQFTASSCAARSKNFSRP